MCKFILFKHYNDGVWRKIAEVEEEDEFEAIKRFNKIVDARKKKGYGYVIVRSSWISLYSNFPSLSEQPKIFHEYELLVYYRLAKHGNELNEVAYGEEGV